MTYHALAEFARSWGLVYLVALFAGAVGYALWPGNARKFEQAARLPLEEE
jgi:cytochrome c oxidase cbb3-type subunit IV